MKRTKTKSPVRRRRLLAIGLVFLFAISLYFAFMPQDFWRLTASGGKLFGANEFALRTLRRIDNPDSEVQLEMARLAYSVGNYELSSKLFLTVGPDSNADISALGVCLSKLGRWMEAVPVLEEAQKSDANNPQLLTELADSYAFLGLYDKSLTTLDLLAKSGQPNAARYRRGIIFREKGDFPAFIKEWSDLVRSSVTEDVRALEWEQLRLELAEVCVTRGMFSEAKEVLDSVGSTARSEFILGKAAIGLGDRDLAIRHWTRSMELQPKAVAPRVDMAKMYLAQGKLDDALKILKDVVVEDDSNSVDVCNLMHMIFVQRKDEEKAATWKKKRDDAEARSSQMGKLIRLSTRLDTVTGKIIRAWKFASSGNQSQALTILQPMVEEIEKTNTNSSRAIFVRKLERSIREGLELPDLLELVDAGAIDSQDQQQ